jgi:type II secretory ATPase GspE/PulE/Tfp pilus assembly ATPase PilB-like protein
MGMDPFNFADAMLTIVAQRLTRRLCAHCKEPCHPEQAEYDNLVEAYGRQRFQQDGLPPFSEGLTLMRARGCERCEGQGYSGRIAIHEQLVNSPQIKEAIKHNAGVEMIQETAQAQGMSTLRMDGIQKIFQGLTDLAQVNRVVL